MLFHGRIEHLLMCNIQFVGTMLYETRGHMQAGKTGIDGDVEKMPLIQRMVRHRLVSTHEAMCDQDIISECMGHV